MTTDEQTPVARHWIDGNWCDSAKHQDSFDPATGEKIGSYAVGGADEAREAVAAALRAFRETDWKQRPQLLDLLAEDNRLISNDVANVKTHLLRLGRRSRLS